MAFTLDSGAAIPNSEAIRSGTASDRWAFVCTRLWGRIRRPRVAVSNTPPPLPQRLVISDIPLVPAAMIFHDRRPGALVQISLKLTSVPYPPAPVFRAGLLIAWGDMGRLVCRRCAADVQNTFRCHTCGAMHPTSELRAALLSPSAFGFYSLVLLVFVLLSNW
jgi:hypothetical protein